jgi:hypothetical protein
MSLWHNGHGPAPEGGNSGRAAVSPQSFLIYDMAEFLHTLGVRSVSASPREGFRTGRGLRGL